MRPGPDAAGTRRTRLGKNRSMAEHVKRPEPDVQADDKVAASEA